MTTVYPMRRWLEAVISGRKRGFAPSLYLFFATLPSFFYAIGALLRPYLSHFTYRSSLPVVSVGNVVAGGSGKTQMILLLAERLKREKKVAILLRGYPLSQREPLLVHAKMDVCSCGDEALLLARRVEDAFVIVGRDRMRSAQLAEKLGAEVLLLDDGMQQRQLAKDVEIVLGPAEGSFLPKGRLRDLPSRAKRADLFLDSGQIKSHVLGIFTPEGEPMPLPKKVAVFCGIGTPERFVETVQQMGCEVLKTLFLADHETADLKQLGSFAEGVDALLCTEKDLVKLPADLPLKLGWVKVALEIVEKKEAVDALIERIRLL